MALLAQENAFPLQVQRTSVSVDPQAYVGHVGQLSVAVAARMGFRDVVGRGSGQAFQLCVALPHASRSSCSR